MLDEDDERPPYIQVADALRAAIDNGKYRPGDKLPSRSELARAYEVAPMTVQNALRELRADGLIRSRQGSGIYVRQQARQDAESRNREALRILEEIHCQTDDDPSRCRECRDSTGQNQLYPCQTMQKVAPLLTPHADTNG